MDRIFMQTNEFLGTFDWLCSLQEKWFQIFLFLAFIQDEKEYSKVKNEQRSFLWIKWMKNQQPTASSDVFF